MRAPSSVLRIMMALTENRDMLGAIARGGRAGELRSSWIAWKGVLCG